MNVKVEEHLQYKVSNLAPQPILRSFLASLMDEEEFLQYQKYKESDEFLGRNGEERANNKRRPESLKARPFINNYLKRGVMWEIYVRQDGVSVPVPTRMWSLGPNLEAFLELSENKIFMLADEFKIDISAVETDVEIYDLFIKKFGKPETILKGQQIIDSGLLNHVRKEIQAQLQPGEIKPRTYKTGFLKIEEISSGKILQQKTLKRVKNSKEDIKKIKEKIEQTQKKINDQYDEMNYKQLQAEAKRINQGLGEGNKIPYVGKSEADIRALLKKHDNEN